MLVTDQITTIKSFKYFTEDLQLWEAACTNCAYAQQLLQKLLTTEYYANHPLALLKIKKAIYYAKKFHASQFRQSGEPYYTHPLAVAYMVADYLYDPETIISSILHDTIEDTTLTKEHLTELFGAKIAEQVNFLTKWQLDYLLTSEDLIVNLFKFQKYDLLLIKYFDRMHNMLTIQAKLPAKIKKISEETLAIFLDLGTKLKIKKNSQTLLFDLCIKQANNNKYA